MKLFIVLQIKTLKKQIKIFISIFIICPFIIFGQNADSVKIDYNFIDSYPQNAEVNVNDVFIGNTPVFFQWSDSTFPKTVKITMNGFNEQSEIISNIG